MTSENVIFSIPGFVDVVDEPKLEAVRLRYRILFDEAGKNIPNAVRAAANHATANGLKNWVADTQLTRDDLSETDASWVASDEFRTVLLNSPIETFVLIPAPEIEPGVDDSWIPAWREQTEQGFGGRISVLVLDEIEMAAHFSA